MRKPLTAASVLALGLAACGSQDSGGGDDGTLVVGATAVPAARS